MKAHQAEHAVVTLCRVLELSRSGFYAWGRRKPSAHAHRDEEVLAAIREEHLGSLGIYGAPRIREMLRRRDIKVGKKRVARLMRDAGLVYARTLIPWAAVTLGAVGWRSVPADP